MSQFATLDRVSANTLLVTDKNKLAPLSAIEAYLSSLLSSSLKYASTAVDYTIPASNYCVFVDASGGDVVIDLPSPDTGSYFEVIKTSNTGGKVTVNAGAGTLNGSSTVDIPALQYGTLTGRAQNTTTWWLI